MTTDRDDPKLKEYDKDGMQKTHLVLPDENRKKEHFIRPLRKSYMHNKCGTVTTMGESIAETYAANPRYYSSTWCSSCKGYFPVGDQGEFIWDDGSGQKVGT